MDLAGETTTLPDAATALPLSVTVVAPEVLHEMVERLPAVMEVGEALMEADTRLYVDWLCAEALPASIDTLLPKIKRRAIEFFNSFTPWG